MAAQPEKGNAARCGVISEREKITGLEARTRLLAEPLSPRGPQPVNQSYCRGSFCSIGRRWHLFGYPGPITTVLVVYCFNFSSIWQYSSYINRPLTPLVTSRSLYSTFEI